ncbi:MAG TPA: sulfurtransferase [Acidiferrobacter sp.]|nr:sulfurtransferase [Acidiferrobacter sp.]
MTELYTTVVDADVLGAHIGNPKWVVLDCRFVLGEPEAGQEDYALGHLPGAQYADLERDLSGPRVPGAGRHPLPTALAFRETLGRWGITPDSQVVAYDEASAVFASRLWWMLRHFCGHKAVAVLNGGLSAWLRLGLPVAQELPHARSAPPYPAYVPAVDTLVDTDTVADVVAGRAPRLLIDARGPDRFRGAVEPLDPVAGHIPGAINRPFGKNLCADDTFCSPEVLRQAFVGLIGERGGKEVVHYCGSGVSACHNILAMEIAGYGATTLYPGSWSAWVSDTTHPVVQGP